VEDAHEAIAKGAQGLVVGVVGTPVIGTNTPFSAMLAMKALLRAPSSRTLSPISSMAGSRCSSVPIGWPVPSWAISLMVVSVMIGPFCEGRRGGRLFCLPSGTEDLGRHEGRGAQGPGAQFPHASSASAAETVRALCPPRSGGRGLERSGPPAIIESQKANKPVAA
jgi:hypothetical protein